MTPQELLRDERERAAKLEIALEREEETAAASRLVIARTLKRIIDLEVGILSVSQHADYDCQKCGDCDVLDVAIRNLAAQVSKPITPKRPPDCLSAVYFDCLDSPTLTLESEQEALEMKVDFHWDRRMSKSDNVAKLCPIEVKAYSRQKLPDSWISDRVDCVLEDLEMANADYGDPDGNHDTWEKEELALIRGRLDHAMCAAFETATVWQCEVISTESYEFEQVIEMLGDYLEGAT